MFVGGGTPSLLGGIGLGDVLDAIRAHFSAGRRCRGHHRGQSGVDVAAVVRRSAGRRLHPHLVGHAVGRPSRVGRARPCSLAGAAARRRRRGAGRGVRARQPGPHLRDAGGDRRRLAPLRRRRDRGRSGPRIRLRARRRGRHGAGTPGSSGRARCTRQRRARPALRAARRAAVAGRLRLVRGLQLE